MVEPSQAFFDEATHWRSLLVLREGAYRVDVIDDRLERRVWVGQRVKPSERSGSRRWWASPELAFVSEGGSRRVLARPAAGAWDVIELVEQGRVRGRIARRNFLHSRFDIETGDGGRWVFRKPLFRIDFRADSSDGRFAAVMVAGRVHQWAMAVREADDPGALLRLALVYLHVRSYHRG